MSNLIKQSVLQIQQIRGELMRYEASIPNAIDYLEALTSGHYTMGTGDKEKLRLYCDNLSRFLKLVHHVSGNFPFALFQSDETIRLMSLGYTILYGDLLIPYSQAASILGCTEFVFYRLVYPNKGQPALTAYFDPTRKIRGHGSRVLVTEVRTLKESNRE